MPFILVNAHRLHYTDSHASSSESQSSPRATLIFVHGLGSTQNYYTPILPLLTQSGYRCISFDNYGAGRSEFNEGQAASIEGIGSDVIAILDELKVSKAVVVGYSMGGMVPTYLASTKPERVVAGICIGPVNPSSGVAEVFRKRIETVKAGGIETMANTIPNAATGSRATPLHRAFIREMIMAQNPEGYIANCNAISAATPPSYADVKVPILIIAGAEDKSAPLDGCKFIFQHLGTPEKDKRLEVLDGVGHWHCVEAGDKVGELVKSFCDQLQL